MKYDYASNVRMIDVNPAMLNLDTGKIGEILTKQMGIAVSETGKHCDIADGGGWEIVSHDLQFFGNRLAVSFVLRRPK